MSVQVYVAKWVSDMEEKELLKELRIIGLEYGSRVAGCMENTRQDLLKDVEGWLTDMEAPNILWIEGHPGVGKSAIATSLVKQLRASSRLGSYFFFQRQKATEMTPDALWRTIAYDLAQIYPTVRSCLIAKLKAKEIDLVTDNTDDLFHNLIYEPLMASDNIQANQSPVIVIDALDECGGVAGQRSNHRKRLISTLKKWPQLPKKFKIVITSRAEGDVKRLFSSTKHKPITIPVGQSMDHESANDVRTFLEKEFGRIQEEHEMLTSDWPGPQTIQELSIRAGGLFIWAKTVVNFIEEATPKKRLREVLGGNGIGNVGTLDGTGIGNMGALYSQIIGALFPQQAHASLKDFRSIIGAVIVANASLTTHSVARLLSIDEEMVVHICRGLQSVMEYAGDLQFKHQSFVDFLLDSVGCPPEFQVNLQQANADLSIRCLMTMNSELEFNICKIESSYLSNAEIKDLEWRIGQQISGALQYSCLHWYRHLCSDWDPAGVDILTPLHTFLRADRPLHWMEVLSVMGKVPIGISALRQVKACSNVCMFAPRIKLPANKNPHIEGWKGTQRSS
jgi:NACHT domain